MARCVVAVPGMRVRFPGGPRIVALAALGGAVAFVGQSCDARRAERQAATSLPGAAPAAPGTTTTTDASSTSAEVVAGSTDDPAAPRLCGGGGDECPAGFICCPQCCLASLPPSRAGDRRWPSLPDLFVDEGMLATKAYLETIDGTECEVAEGCLGGPGKRRVLRFDVQVPNRGAADLVLGNPDAGGPFEYATCHKHYHFTGFAHYRIVAEDDGRVVLLGRKQAFCARDSMRVDRSAPYNARYDCALQGIQVGWSDIYDPLLALPVPRRDRRAERHVPPRGRGQP